MPNRLAAEHSPYLLQHKDNPVDWYSWGDEAFARARGEQKPIFLSIGYSTCHWCHVMERESFEEARIAEALNRSFVSIKVDREERPDVDRVYMTFVQATTGSGGWPMSVWLTPALEPFYGGTYFPPSARWGRPGFLDVLLELERIWKTDRDQVLRSAANVVAQLAAFHAHDGEASVPGAAVLDDAVTEFAGVFDPERGGFGRAPKFPRPSELLFLLREYARTGSPDPLRMATATLRAMALGGMRDHLGGGFHRYSVDGAWRVPHFEKMLYDQAQLVLAYIEGAQASGDAWYLDVAIDTLEYLRHDLTDPSGGFYSAEDADSVPPEEVGRAESHPAEGAFYIWSDTEIAAVLGSAADTFRRRYGVLPAGNAPADPQGEFRGKNLLYVAQAVEQIARDTGRTVEEVSSELQRSRATLLERRAGRPRPHLDDKVLTAWNGLAIAACSRAARALLADPAGPGDARRETCLLQARRAATFVRDHLWDGSTRALWRRYRRENAGVPAYAEDYASLIFGLLELFQTDGDPQWLEWALVLQQQQDERFGDAADEGWFSTSTDDASVLLRLKDDHDGAEPAASSIGVLNLMTLSHLVGDTGGRAEVIERTLSAFAGRSQSGRAMPMMLAALSSYHAGVTQVVVVGNDMDREMAALLRVTAERYRPSTIVVPVVNAHRDAIERLLPWIATMRPEGGPAAYVCRQFSCDVPARSEEELRARFGEAMGRSFGRA